MSFQKRLEIEDEYYESTIKVLINNGLKVKEHHVGSRRTLYANNEICGFNKVNYHLPLSDGLTTAKFNAFLAYFSRTLYSQFKQNPDLFNLKIQYTGLSKGKDSQMWNKIKSREVFYNIDLSSAYWQIAYRLGYINTKIFEKYMPLDEYKEAKRYCVSFLARENKMNYFDNREINLIECDMSVLYQVYENIRHELYNIIEELKNHIKFWIEYNIDGISVTEKYLQKTKSKFDELGLIYKVNECFKIDNKSYFLKNTIRKF